MEGELPNCGAVSLIVSWFGDDLRAGQCSVRRRWNRKRPTAPGCRGGVRAGPGGAGLIAQVDGRAIYGGTPTDQSVVEAIEAMNAAGRR